MDKDIELGKRIAWLRVNRGLEQTAAAEGMGIVYGTYQRYEYGYPPSRKNIEAILQYYKCTKSWLLTGEGVPYPDKPDERPEPDHHSLEKMRFDRMAKGIKYATKIFGANTPHAEILLRVLQVFDRSIDAESRIEDMQKTQDELRARIRLLEGKIKE